MKYRAVLFDLDGTLLDYKKAQKSVTGNSCLLFDLVNSPEVQSYEARGVPLPGSPEMKKAFLKAQVTEDTEPFLKDYFEKLSRHAVLIDGAVEILESLLGRVKLGIVSNGSGEVQNPRLEKAGLSRFFSCRFFSRDTGTAKPDPAILRLAMREMGVTANETLFIGDSTTSDQPAALAAGIDFFLFKGDFNDRQLNSLLFKAHTVVLS